MCRGFETTYRVRFAAMTVGVLAVACLASRAASAGPIIHEVFYDAVGSDTGQVFTEIYGEAGMGLSGWSLVGINGSSGSPYRTIDLTGAVIPADSLLVIAQSSATPLLAGFRDFVANVDWQNGPDAVQFLDPWGGGSRTRCSTVTPVCTMPGKAHLLSTPRLGQASRGICSAAIPTITVSTSPSAFHRPVSGRRR